MKTQLETLSRVSDTELTQGEVDKRFDAMFDHMEELYRVETSLDHTTASMHANELESIRNGILGELLDRNPHEAIAELVQSLALLYEGRTVDYRQGEATVQSFATRDTSNEWLDDHFDVIRHDSGDVELRASCRSSPDMGLAVQSYNDEVQTYTLVQSYKIPSDRNAKTPDGSPTTHERILRDFYLRTLSTAGYVLHRRQTDPEGADRADEQAKLMLEAELLRTDS